MKTFLASIILSAVAFTAEQKIESKRDSWTQAQIQMIEKSYSDLVEENSLTSKDKLLISKEKPTQEESV